MTLTDPKPLLPMIKISCNVCDVTHEVSYREIDTTNKLHMQKTVANEMWDMITKHIEGHKKRGEL